MKRHGLYAFVIATAALSGSALAADISPVVVPPPVVIPPPPPTVAGYIDLHFGMVRGWEDFYIEDQFEGGDLWRLWVLGGSGRGATPVGASALHIQLDEWFNFVFGNELVTPGALGADGEVGRGGIGGHLFFGTAGGINAGAVGTVGVVTGYGVFANVGGEASASFGNFTVAAQGGYTFAITGDAAFDGYRNMYARLGGTFYVGPNTSIAANVGLDRTALVNENVLGRQLSWGARVEHKLGGSPFTIFAAYEGYRWIGVDFDDLTNWIGTEHAFVVGVRMLFGRDTLQALDAAVPFADYNPTYGDPFIR